MVVIDFILRRSADAHGFEYEQRKSSRNPAKLINDLDYADDIALLERLTQLANQQLLKLSNEAKRVGLIINIEKTQFMAFNQPAGVASIIELDGKQLKEVPDFQYLGSRMASAAADLKHRSALAWTAFWELDKLWRAKHVRMKLKLNIFQASVISILLYGCEAWIVNEAMANKINSFATNFYRIMLGIRKSDRIGNDAIYKEVQEHPLVHTVQQRQLSWLDHALTRDVC